MKLELDHEVSGAAEWEDDSISVYSPPQSSGVAHQALPQRSPQLATDSHQPPAQVVASDTIAASGSAAHQAVGQLYRVLHNIEGIYPSEFSIKQDDTITFLNEREDDWWLVKDAKGNQGWVPFHYLEPLENNTQLFAQHTPVNTAGRGMGSTAHTTLSGNGPLWAVTAARGRPALRNSRQGNLKSTSASQITAAGPNTNRSLTGRGRQQLVYSGLNPAANAYRAMPTGRSFIRTGNNRSNRGRELRTGSKDIFVKVPGPLTHRAQEALQNAKEAKALENRFMGEPGDREVFESIGLYNLHGVEDAEELLGDKLQEVNLIRQKHHAFLDYQINLNSIRIRSHNEDSMKDVLKAIRLRIKELEVVTSASAPKYLVYPIASSRFRKIVVASSIPVLHSPPIAHSMMLVGPGLTEAEQMAYDRPAMLASVKSKYFESLKTRLNELRSLKCWMRLRICFGTAQFNRYNPAIIDPGMAYEDFCKMMRTNRTRGKFELNMGGLSLADQIIQRITPAVFCPASTSTFNDTKDVKPIHTYIVFVKDTNGIKTRLEMALEEICEYDSYRAGPVNCFQHAEDKKRLDITTIFIGEKFDMSHELIINTLLQNRGHAMNSLIAKFEEGVVCMKTDADGKRYPTISFLKDHFRPRMDHEELEGGLIVESVVLRSSWVFALIDSGYEMDVSIYREWKGHKTSTEAKKTWVNVSAYHPEWDSLMEEVEPVNGQRHWDPELHTFFPKAAGENDGFLRFLNKMREIQGYLG